MKRAGSRHAADVRKRHCTGIKSLYYPGAGHMAAETDYFIVHDSVLISMNQRLSAQIPHAAGGKPVQRLQSAFR